MHSEAQLWARSWKASSRFSGSMDEQTKAECFWETSGLIYVNVIFKSIFQTIFNSII